MTLLDGTVIPKMTRTEARKKLFQRFNCDNMWSGYRDPFAHKMANGTYCLVIYGYTNYEWIPILLKADSGGFEGAWYMLDIDEAYETNEKFDAEQVRRETVCRLLLYPYRPKRSFWSMLVQRLCICNKYEGTGV